jgi:hypothetical protein
MAFYQYRQNNSGGGFDFDEDAGISVYVIIEADSAREANNKAEEIGLYFDGRGDCSTCGYRWSGASEHYDRDERPKIYDTPIEDLDWNHRLYIKWITSGPEAYVHFKDGHVQAYGLPAKQL